MAALAALVATEGRGEGEGGGMFVPGATHLGDQYALGKGE